MRVFVTGGNGFIGSRVVRELVEQGHEPVLLLRQSSKTHRIDGLPWARHLGDVREWGSLVEGMKGCEAVIHLASISSWEQIRSPLMREIVIGGTKSVLEAAKQAGNLRVVYVSSVTAVGGTKEPVVQDENAAFKLPPEPFVYAGAKREAEALCQRYASEGLPVVIVLPCEVYGPEDDDFITASYLRDAIKDFPAFYTDGGTAVAHVEDIARGIVSALTRGRSGERYILGGENLSIKQIIETTLEEAGKKGKMMMHLPTGPTLWLVGTLSKLKLPTPVHPDLLAHGVLYWFVDSKKAREELGWTHRPARETIRDVVRWLKEAGHVPA